MLPATARTLTYLCGLAGVVAIAVVLYTGKSVAQSGKESPAQTGTVADSGNAAPIYGVKIPSGYRDWKLIAVDNLAIPKLNVDQLRAQLGYDTAIKAFEEGTIPFPDGTIIAALHWTRIPSDVNNKVLAGPFPSGQSHVIGSAVNVQFMVKDRTTSPGAAKSPTYLPDLPGLLAPSTLTLEGRWR